MSEEADAALVPSAFQSPTFEKDISFHVNEAVSSASISPSGRDVVLASRHGLYIIDLDEPYNPPRHLPHSTPWEVADVQWSPFAARAFWVVSTSNQKALVWNLEMSQTGGPPIEHVLHAHSRAITDINFSAHDPDVLATCAVDSFVHCWDLKHPLRPAITFANWFAGATQVKWNRQDPNIVASSHETALHIWDRRKGSNPLVTIEAHATKIYGIDWSRLDRNKILTCSLDRTIKFWDYAVSESTPSEVINTSYPVWRARHTPFGQGVLAMPQRGDYQLHLYRHGTGEIENNTPVHSFRGHQQPVKEFLWRSRGNIDNDTDDRDFQMVSWGMDKYLLLHHVNVDVLGQVGYVKGQSVDKRLHLTRKGATYRTYQVSQTTSQPADRSTMSSSHALSDMFRDHGRSKIKTESNERRETSSLVVSNPVRGGNHSKGTLNPITWMKGVKISKSNARPGKEISSAEDPRSPNGSRWPAPESLGDEITQVGEKYKKVAFDRVDISAGLVSLSLNGPWGADDSLVHIKTTLHFPKSYPDVSPPSVKIEKTSSISDATYSRLTHAMKTICESYASMSCTSFEPVVCYLLGERDLNSSMAWLGEINESMSAGVDGHTAESSSDEEDNLGAAYMGLPMDPEASGIELGTATANANVPLPKACGALWSNDGRLICFFPPKGPIQSSVGTINLEGDQKPSSSRHEFQSYGRLQLGSFPPTRRGQAGSFDSDLERDLSDLSSLSSSPSGTLSSASSSPDSTYARDGQFPSLSTSRQLFKTRSIGQSQPSSARTLMKHGTNNQRNIVSIHNLEDMLPAKKSLAEEYTISGNCRQVCENNAEIAAKYGNQGLADVWNLLALLLYNEVPLELVNVPQQTELIPVMARRVLVHIKRKDSGLDLSFDKPESVTVPIATSYVKWGEHPLACTWFIEQIFDYFESIADTQTLAVVASVLAQAQVENARHVEDFMPLHEHSTGRPRKSTTNHYFPTIEVAQAMSQQISPNSDGLNVPDPGSANFGSLGSSSGGAWGTNMNANDRRASFAAGITPPAMTRQSSRTSTNGPSLSSSPEQQMKRSNSTVGNALAASFSRPFSFLQSASSSPPSHTRVQAELSTSAPSSGSLGAMVRSRSRLNNESSTAGAAQANTTSHLYDSDTEEDVAVADDRDDVYVSLKNQSLFDDEGYSGAPLLKPDAAARYYAYRQAYSDLLHIWGLTIARCEILKLNGPVSSRSDAASFHVNVFDRSKTANVQAPLTADFEALSYEPHCQWCTALLPRQSDEPTCVQCRRARSKMPCSICSEAVTGLFKLCVNCGHVAHAACFDAWLLSHPQLNLVECEAACGCLCAQTMDIPHVELDEDQPQKQFIWENTQARDNPGNRPGRRKSSTARRFGRT